MIRIPRGALLLWLPLLLLACSTVPQIPPGKDGREALYGARVDRLSLAEAWELEGRLAISDGKDGGSGYFSWQKDPDSDHMAFHGALGRGAWRLDSSSGGARLELADGSVYLSDTLEDLVRLHVGWRVPVDYLAWWVRGLAAPGASDRALDEQGRLVDLRQAGWVIEFGRYRNFGGEDLPVKVTARREESTVKLAIRRWEFSDGKSTNG